MGQGLSLYQTTILIKFRFITPNQWTLDDVMLPFFVFGCQTLVYAFVLFEKS